MSITSPQPSYSQLSHSTGKPEPLRDELRKESLKNCKDYLSEYLELVRRSDDGKNFEIINEVRYDNLIKWLLYLWFEYNKVYSRSGYNIDTITEFGEHLITSLKSSIDAVSVDDVSVDAVSIDADKLELFKKLAIYDKDLSPENKSKADVGIMNLITRALKDSKDKRTQRTLFRTQYYGSPIIAEIICHFLRVYFNIYFRLLRKQMLELNDVSKLADISKLTDLLIRLDKIITLDDNHSCIHIHTGVGKRFDGDRARFCKQIEIICREMDKFGIKYTYSKSVVKLCNTSEVEMKDLSPTTAGGRSSRRRKAYKTTRRNNKHKNKKNYRRKRHTKRCKKSNRRRRSRR